MRWIRRAVMGVAASWAWSNRERIKRTVSGFFDDSQAERSPATTRT